MNTRFTRALVLALLIGLFGTGIAASQGRIVDAEADTLVPVSIEATVNSRISFQGVLSENGQPVNGSQSIDFTLYSDDTCSTQIGSVISVSNVPIVDGRFGVQLDVPQTVFNGQAVYIKMSANNGAAGCWEILPTPYALSLRPGALIYGDTEGSIIQTRNSSTADIAYGLLGQAYGPKGVGVVGRTRSTTGVNYGTVGRTDSTTDLAAGVYGNASGASGVTIGVQGHASSSDGYGVYGVALSTSGDRRGVVGLVSGTGYGLYTPDELYVGGSCTGCTTTYEALNTHHATLQIGEVVAVSGVGSILEGHTTPVLEVRPATVDDVGVLGVVYRRGELYKSMSDEPELAGDTIQPTSGDVAPGDYLFVATTGLAQVRVADAATFIPGQALTVASATGTVEAATADAAPHRIFARTVEASADETGLIWTMLGRQ